MADEFARAEAEKRARREAGTGAGNREEKQAEWREVHTQAQAGQEMDRDGVPARDFGDVPRDALDENQQAAMQRQVEKASPAINGREAEKAAQELMQRENKDERER